LDLFDECIAATSSPNTDNIIAVVKSDASTQFDYQFATHGDSSLVMSTHDDRVASSVLQEASDAWSRVGFSSFPEPPYDNVYNVRYNYSECMSNVLNPSLETLEIFDGTDAGSAIDGDGTYGPELTTSGAPVKHFPFGLQKSCYQSTINSSQDVEIRLETYYASLTIYDDDDVCDFDVGFASKGISVWSLDDCVATGKYGRCQEPEVTMERHITAWSNILNTPSDASGSFSKELICESMERNGNGFRCFDKPKPPATKEQAIELYASEYPPETICAPLKQNSPFQCTRTVEAPMVTRLSLSLASAQAAFALVGVLFVSILRKMKVSK